MTREPCATTMRERLRDREDTEKTVVEQVAMIIDILVQTGYVARSGVLLRNPAELLHLPDEAMCLYHRIVTSVTGCPVSREVREIVTTTVEEQWSTN